MAGDLRHLLRVTVVPVRVGVLVELIEVFGNLRLSKHLLLLVGAHAGHAGDECRGCGEVQRRQRQTEGRRGQENISAFVAE